MINVALFQNKIMEYRVPIFNRLNEKVNLLVVYSEGSVPEGCVFKTKKIDNKRGKIFWKYAGNIIKALRDYQVAIIPMDIRQFDLIKLILSRQKKTISWGIGVTASYNTPFDSKDISRLLRWVFIRNTDACLFYSQYAKDKYSKYVSADKLFVADNTVEVKQITLNDEKRDILFIGSLYKEKRIFELLEAYRDATFINQDIPELHIVGDGSEKQNIESFINKNGLQGKIYLHGQIFDESILSEMFKKSIACISPNQAGLSVLKSMGYGVPFITHHNAITGGERLNISNGINGVLFQEYSQLKDIIIDITTNRTKYIQMGENAYRYYWENRTADHMIEGFSDAINYVCKGME